MREAIAYNWEKFFWCVGDNEWYTEKTNILVCKEELPLYGRLGAVKAPCCSLIKFLDECEDPSFNNKYWIIEPGTTLKRLKRISLRNRRFWKLELNGSVTKLRPKGYNLILDTMREEVSETNIEFWVEFYIAHKCSGLKEFCIVLSELWTTLDTDTKTAIKKRIEKAFEIDDDIRNYAKKEGENRSSYWLGNDLDRQEWEKVRSLIAAPEPHPQPD